MKYDNFNAVDSGFANIIGTPIGTMSGTMTISPTQPNYQPLPNFKDSFSFDTEPPANIGLPNMALVAMGVPTTSNFLKLIICMEYLGVQGSNPSSDLQYVTARQQWLDRVRPATISFMRNAKTITSVNFLNNQFATANGFIPRNPATNLPSFRFRYYLGYINY
jgi:hypothetical protein